MKNELLTEISDEDAENIKKLKERILGCARTNKKAPGITTVYKLIRSMTSFNEANSC